MTSDSKRAALIAEGQVLSGESLLIRYVNFVKLPHTLFALPFAFLGVLAASRQAPVGLRTILLVGSSQTRVVRRGDGEDVVWTPRSYPEA